ncbi:substrate-binding domain-containing protein [Pseudobacteroides cellulosolvens]|uniref:DNA binding domain protein, excisionase family n=1 Tax=Pseudobacteroides cellulosolvens ATCC 35603 = DSM 2933 TaxID=398512 RepID=A0A0L6JP59_9FIRM|nr:helix-turn-helix transcriptional regulator [Pseudobacteroides cellulosolvens]KNY27568.1 DNA binding domain protein, excisionase family [Pseudobacteroides cellulosolvens ATCC 35603 = DSM 2933]KNY30134.1 DNA binding domain protein, excisionase family [Pseudobacteroides cellulosolvens ATCC 35603 = DSM 2933]
MRDCSSLTPQEVADILKIAKNTVYELIKRGELNAYRIGRKVRVDLNDVEEYKSKSKSQKSNLTNDITQSANSHLLNNDIKPFRDGFIICGQDILLDILSRYLECHPKGVQALRAYIGSYNGLYSLYHGNVQMATTHLWDSETGQYNIPFVKHLLPGIPTVIIHLACRMQGFYVAKSNPKNINTWEDLKRPDITIVNREKGSGARVLLDEHLKLLKYFGSSIKGYSRECLSHLAVASTVARGGADLGIGNEKVALQVQGVDFIPLQKERYDLVIKKEDFEKPPFQAVLEIIRSEEFKMELLGIGGYDLYDIGKIIAET